MTKDESPNKLLLHWFAYFFEFGIFTVYNFKTIMEILEVSGFQVDGGPLDLLTLSFRLWEVAWETQGVTGKEEEEEEEGQLLQFSCSGSTFFILSVCSLCERGRLSDSKAFDSPSLNTSRKELKHTSWERNNFTGFEKWSLKFWSISQSQHGDIRKF